MMTTANRILTTGIGSLPHHNVDAALEYSFRSGIPFLPQIPLRNPWEYMIPQALEGLPGLEVDKDGLFALNGEVWKSRHGELKRKLKAAFAAPASDLTAFEAFEPGASTSSCWQPFLWELEERKEPQAKIQIAGPLTAQWVLRFKDSDEAEVAGFLPGSPVGEEPEITSQIFQLVLARAIAMSRRLRADGIQPILYLDEPGLYSLSATNPKHVLALQELRLVVQTLRKEGTTVGIHCCSNTDWRALLDLGVDILSIDSALSLESLVTRAGDSLEKFLHDGGRLSLGIVPTGRPAVIRSLSAEELFQNTLDIFGNWAPARDNPKLLRKTLREAICTPACGLALQTPSDAEWILDSLEQFGRFCEEFLA